MVLDDKEKAARSAVAKIEAGFVRRFLEEQRQMSITEELLDIVSGFEALKKDISQ
jgi:F0F1-type ATP synthase gamma subunit